MDQNEIFLTIIGMGLVTYGPRLLPTLALASRSLPPLVVAWLRYVPVAVLAAMLLPSILLPEESIDLRFSNLFLWAAIPTLLVGWKTRSLFGSVVVGMLLVAAGRFFFGL
jgi:branched-subunit amino acid transport protein